MRLKFFAVAAAASMIVTSTAAIAAAPFAASPLDQRPSALKVSNRKGEKLDDANGGVPTTIVAVIAIVSLTAGAVVIIENDDGTSPN